jgi:ribonuclease BN (tRNA processing enzyme)
MSENSITILGSSSGLPQAGRATSGYLLKTGDSLSLIDCGGGVTSSFLKRGYDPSKVDRIFISHTHPDHVCELPLFIQLTYLKGRTTPLELYLPEEFIVPFRLYLTSVYIIEEKLPFDLNFLPIIDDFKFNSDSFNLDVIPNNHLKSYEEYINTLGLPNKMQCYSFLITVGEKKIFYSSDIASFDDIKDHLDGCHQVIIESTHIDLDKFFVFAKTINVGQYVITHLGDNEQVKEINQMAQKAGIDNLITAVDGLEVEL